MKSPIQLFAAIAILLATATVAAQVYKWVDKDGKTQYSDIAPPPGATKAEAKRVDTSPAAAALSIKTPPAKSLADRAKDSEKRAADEAEKTKKAAEIQKKTDAEEENCKIAKAVLRDFENDRPLKRTNDQGESVFVTDEQRQAEIAKARTAAAASCKA